MSDSSGPSDHVPLTVTVGPPDAGGAVVTVTGELDLATAHQLTSALERATEDGVTSVELDLEQVRFIDSSGVGAIVLAHRLMVGNGGRLTIGRRSGIVDRVLEVSGIERALGA